MPGFGHGLGEFTLGDFPLSISGSVADPLPGLLANPGIKREFLVRAALSGYIDATYIDESYIAGESVDLSTGGYTSHATDSEYKLFPEGVGRPYSFQASLPIPDRSDGAAPAAITGGSTLGVGAIVVNNPDGLRDADACRDWLGASVDVLLGKPADPLTNFTPIFSGFASGVSKTADSWSILMRDLRFRLQRPLQTAVYRGTGAALRVSTLGDHVAMSGFPSQTGSLMVEGWVYVAAPTSALQQWVTMDDGTHGWSVGTTGVGRIRFLTRGLSNGNLDSPAALSVGWHYVGCMWDDVANVKTIYVDGTVVASASGVTGSLATVSAPLRLFSGNTGNAAPVGTGLDEVRVWNVSRTTADITSLMTRAAVGNESGLIGLYHLDEGAGTATTDDSPTAANGVITGCQWIGSLEGDSSVAGTKKPVALGVARQVTGILVDAQHLVYQLNARSMRAITAAYDSGDPITFGVDLADIYSSPPATGTYNTCLALGLARLGDDPIGAIAWDVEGDNAGPLGYQDTFAGIHRKLAVEFGGLSDPDEIDVAAYVLWASKQPAVIGRYYSSDINVDAAMDDVSKSVVAWWSPTRLGSSTIGRIDAPETQIPTVFVTEDNIPDPDVSSSGSGGTLDLGTPIGVRVGHVKLGYRPYLTQLTGTQAAQTLSTGVRNDLAQQYRYVTSDVIGASADADTLVIYTDMDSATDAQTEADRLAALWGVDRYTRTIPLDTGILSYYFGTVINVTIPRYDLIAGKNHVVVGISEDMGSQSTGGGTGASPTPDSLSCTLFG